MKSTISTVATGNPQSANPFRGFDKDAFDKTDFHGYLGGSQESTWKDQRAPSLHEQVVRVSDKMGDGIVVLVSTLIRKQNTLRRM